MNAMTQTEARAIQAPALEAADSTKNLILVSLSRLVSRPTGRNVRKTPRMSIPELAASIQRVGLLQNLIVIAAADGEHYEVVAGEPRHHEPPPHGRDLRPRNGTRPPLAWRWRRAGLPPASRLDSPRRPDRPAPHHGPRLAACRVVDHRNQRIESSPAPKPFRLGRAECQKSGRGGGRARFQGPKPERPCAAFGQAAQGRRTSSLVRGKPSKPISASAHNADDIPNVAPPQWSGLVGLRPGLLPQVARKRAVLDAGGSSPVRHEGRFTDTPPGLAMEPPRHASSKRPPATSGALSPCRWALSSPVPGRKPVKPSRGKPSRPCFLSERVGPRRPVCL